MDLEDNFLTDYPANLYRIAGYWVDTRTCIDIPVLPDELQQAHVTWKYYANQDQWMNAMQAIKHVRFGPMWNKVQDPGDDPVRPAERQAAGRLVADPAGGQSERASRRRRQHLRGRELDGAVPERDLPVRRLAEHRGRHRVGRLRRLLRPRRAAPLRRHGPRPAHAGADHLAVHASGIEPRRRLDRLHDLRVLERAAIHRGAARARPDDRSRRAGVAARRRVRLHAAAAPGRAEAARARLPDS